ncbi:TetR/AcrR family transcriptional regulator [Glutamicibacter sp. Je.9.36]|uniref:TetR/AcrR family transcriptional regulator n=1 Tax=Glutamicibacter sp. Je.9.36 TaxID=3142837 RepID=UPI003DA83766
MNTKNGRERPARDRLMKAAAELFYAHGMAATGIDAITARAGVARKSLYNNFASKDDLVLAYIEERHLEWLALHERRAAMAQNPRDRVLAVFDAYIDHASTGYLHGFRGCGLLNAAAELPAGDPGRVAVRAHKEQVESILADALTGILGPDRTGDLAEQLAFVLEGAVARAGLEGRADRLVHARAIAASLVDAA